MAKDKKDLIDFIVICTNEFAEHYAMSVNSAFLYLYGYKGIDFLEQFYHIEHTLSFEDVVSDLAVICRKNGGVLE